MRRKAFTALILGLAIALPGIASAENWKRIRTEKNYRSHVVGKTLTADWGWARSNADGTFVGEVKGQGKMQGAWKWQKGFWCRNFVLKGKERGTDCQIIKRAGKKIHYTREKGRGATGVMTIK